MNNTQRLPNSYISEIIYFKDFIKCIYPINGITSYNIDIDELDFSKVWIIYTNIHHKYDKSIFINWLYAQKNLLSILGIWSQELTMFLKLCQ